MDVNDDAGILYARVALVFIASKLAPTFDRRRPKIQPTSNIPCGSEPARESGVTAKIDVD
ncbi:UNVERIFIED_ORG: hypothetical protein J2W87_005654 [Pseudomonas putida]|nr:hypothetical protein [Pseudomonas putida]